MEFLIKLLGPRLFFEIVHEGYYVDQFHPFCFKDPDSINDYRSRAIYMEELNNQFRNQEYSNIITSGVRVKVHFNFILAEFEYLIRELSNKNYRYPIQYAYLEGSHEWDPFIRSLMNN